MKEKKKIIIVKQKEILINAIQNELKDLSKKTIKNYIKHHMVEVDNIVETNSNKEVNKNSSITIYFTPRMAPKINLKIIYEDEDLIAIDKPCGLLSISNDKEKNNTAFRLVSDYIKQKNPKNRLFVIHRLDEQTSGVLLFSKNLKLKELMQKNWNDIVKVREYTCVVEGHTKDSGTIESYLTMNHFQIVHSTKNKEIGKYAKTNYKLLKYKNGFSLLKVEIDTGRRNQIRVHMSEMGNPIVGDKKYGSNNNQIGRLALHASRLSLIDPRTNKILDLKSETPNTILNIVK